MRKFFLLTYQAYANDLQSVVDHSMGRFDSAQLRKGLSFHGSMPPDVQLIVDDGEISDLLANPLSWLILSKKLYEIFHRFAPDDMQIIDVPIFNKDRTKRITDYYVTNLLRIVRAVDMERSVVKELKIIGKGIPHVMEFVFKGELIPANVHLFRPQESMSDVAVSQELVSAFKGQVTGVSLIKTKTV